jgi:hypothetical protein
MEVEKTSDNQTEADDITVATATKATKTDYIAQEMEEQEKVMPATTRYKTTRTTS